MPIYKYQRIIKTYKKFKRHFDFLRIKTTITTIVKDCEIYIKTKASRYKSYKNLQTLLIFKQI